MSEESYLFVGGPKHGVRMAIADGVSVVIDPHYDDMAYHRNHWPLGGTDPNWWIRNEPEPGSVTVFEWHELDWVPPAVEAIREAVRR